MQLYLRQLMILSVLFFPLEGASSRQAKDLPSDTLAEVGSRVITTRDFLERIELMPWMGKERKGDLDSVKIRALQSLVAEQLLSLDAPVNGIGTDTLSALRYKTLEHMLARDELYKREVKSKVAVSENEMRRGLRRYMENVRLLLLVARSESASRSVSKELKTSSNVDSTLRSLTPSRILKRDTVVASFGGLDTTLENAVYLLSTKNRISEPIRTEDFGWVVLYFIDRYTNPEAAEQSLPDRRRAVETKIKERKEVQASRRYQGSVLHTKMAKVREDLFYAFASATIALLKADTSSHMMKGKYTITGADIDSLEVQFWPKLQEELVEMEGGGLTMGEVIEAFRNHRFLFPSLQEDDFTERLNGSIKSVVQGEYMAREALGQKLELSKDVVRDLNTWTNYLHARLVERKALRSVSASDEEVLAYLVARASTLGRPYEVNVREILVDSLETMSALVEQLNEGKEMAELARRYSKRSSWAANGGESGFFGVSEHPELGFFALEQDTGKISGPIRLPEGYSVFTLLGKRAVGSDSIPPFESVKKTVREVLLAQKSQRIMNQYVASLARRFPVRIHYARLAQVDVIPSNMYTTRYLGFGGVMPAVPVIHPQWQWVRDVNDLEGILP